MSDEQLPRPRVTRLSVTPVKGFALHHPDSVQLDRSGASGDRDFFLVDDRNKLFSITRSGRFTGWSADFDPGSQVLTFSSRDGETVEVDTTPGRPVVANFFDDKGVPGHFVEGPWNARLSELAGQPVTLVRTKHTGEGHDEYPVTMLADESVADLAQRSGLEAIDPRRFRMLIGFAGVSPYEEDSWRRRRVQAGTAVLRVGGPVPRCAAVTREPDTGERDLQTLHLIHEHRGRQPNEFGDGLNFGVYAEVEQPGRVGVGDQLVLL